MEMKISRFFSCLIVILFMLRNQPAFAHGEDKLGPHGGFIRMPGAFHVEVIPEKNGLKIMLLDITFEHPTIQDSSMKAVIISGTTSIALKCRVNSDSFFCPVPQRLLLKKGELAISAVRKQAQGATVEYDLPLTLTENHGKNA